MTENDVLAAKAAQQEATLNAIRELVTPISDQISPDHRGRYAETTFEGARIEAARTVADDVLEILDKGRLP